MSAQSSKRWTIGGWVVSVLGGSLAVMALTLNRTSLDIARNDMTLKLADMVSVLNEGGFRRYADIASLATRAQLLRIGEGGYVLMAREGKIVASPVAESEGCLLSELGFDPAGVEPGEFVRRRVAGENCLVCYEMAGDMLLVGVLPMSEVRTVPRACMNAFLLAAAFGILLLIAIPSKCL